MQVDTPTPAALATPTTIHALAESLSDDAVFSQVPFGSDFLMQKNHGRPALLHYDLLRHLAVLEGRKHRLSDMPIQDDEVLQLLRHGTPAFTGEVQEEITEASLTHYKHVMTRRWKMRVAGSGG